MKKTFLKRIVPIITGVTLLSSLSFTGVSAFDSFELTQDFDSGLSLPWYTIVDDAAEIEYDTSSGAAEITIINPGGRERGGEDIFDISFLRDGIYLRAGDEYEVSWEITASNDGRYLTVISDNFMYGDLGWEGNWKFRELEANQKSTVTDTFVCKEGFLFGTWHFLLGGAGQYDDTDCFPAGTVITIDNISITNLADQYRYSAGYNDVEQNNLIYRMSSNKNLSIPAEVIGKASDSSDKYAVILDNINGRTVERIAKESIGYYRNQIDGMVKIDGYTIYGKTGSVAEKYAIENGFNFAPIGTPIIKGDLNGNGFIRAKDLQLMKSGLIKGGISPNSDMNDDGKVNVFDLISQKKEFINTNNNAESLDINYSTHKIDTDTLNNIFGTKPFNSIYFSTYLDYSNNYYDYDVNSQLLDSLPSEFSEKYDDEYFKYNDLILVLYPYDENYNQYDVGDTVNEVYFIGPHTYRQRNIDIIASSSPDINNKAEYANLMLIEFPYDYASGVLVGTIYNEE